MAKQKKKRKANPHSRQRPTQNAPRVRLSQCMIVRDEEANIERALSWAKDIAFEQIVVDTGSVDRTVEIAERMGAKVFHFDWIDDFAAAKNYAIEQASGNWIAFLDADEYFTDEHAVKLGFILSNMEISPDFRRDFLSLSCPLYNLDEDGVPTIITQQIRVFRNIPEMRYFGRIHERLSIADRSVETPDITILHTGYANNVLDERGKLARNITMLRRELEDTPDDLNLQVLLADSLNATGSPENVSAAEDIYLGTLSAGGAMLPEAKRNAYSSILGNHFKNGFDLDDDALCRRAVAEFPANADFNFYYGVIKSGSGEYNEAWKYLSSCEKALSVSTSETARFINVFPKLLFREMMSVAGIMLNYTETVRCATLALREDKYQADVLGIYLGLLKSPESGTTDEDIIGLLSKLYDLTSTKDKLFTIRAAKDAGQEQLMQSLYALLTPEELEWLSAPQED